LSRKPSLKFLLALVLALGVAGFIMNVRTEFKQSRIQRSSGHNAIGSIGKGANGVNESRFANNNDNGLNRSSITFHPEPLVLEPFPTHDASICHCPGRGVPLKIYIMMHAWNNVALLHKAIASVAGQDLPSAPYDVSLTLLVFEDLSANLLTQEERLKLNSTMDIHFLRADKCTSCEKLGSAGAKWALISYLQNMSVNPNDYVMILDGDDTLADKHVIRDLAAHVLPQKPWFIWGMHNGKYSEQCSDLPRHASLEDKFPFRKDIWRYCHPRIFQAHLLALMSDSDFKRKDGSWLQKATDRGLIFKMLETSGPRRAHFFHERGPSINYSFTPNNGLRVFSKQTIQNDKNYVNGLPALQPGVETIHVVVAVWDRTRTDRFVQHLVKSKAPQGNPVRFAFHICLNNASRFEELSAIVRLHSSPNRVVRVHVMGGNYGGFSRFLVARRLRTEELASHFIMVDDDMYVRANTLWQLWLNRAPMTYACVHGKNWFSKRNPVYFDIAADRSWLPSHVKYFQYCGTGGSIIDGSIFGDPLLLRIPGRFLFVEDLWLSYVVKLKGWEVVRLPKNINLGWSAVENNRGQWKKLRKTKQQMLDALVSCSFSIQHTAILDERADSDTGLEAVECSRKTMRLSKTTEHSTAASLTSRAFNGNKPHNPSLSRLKMQLLTGGTGEGILDSSTRGVIYYKEPLSEAEAERNVRGFNTTHKRKVIAELPTGIWTELDWNERLALLGKATWEERDDLLGGALMRDKEEKGLGSRSKRMLLGHMLA
jgi:hypothetical protein